MDTVVPLFCGLQLLERRAQRSAADNFHDLGLPGISAVPNDSDPGGISVSRSEQPLGEARDGSPERETGDERRETRDERQETRAESCRSSALGSVSDCKLTGSGRHGRRALRTHVSRKSKSACQLIQDTLSGVLIWGSGGHLLSVGLAPAEHHVSRLDPPAVVGGTRGGYIHSVSVCRLKLQVEADSSTESAGDGCIHSAPCQLKAERP